MNTFKTQSVRKEDVKKEWILVDAESQVVGRLASEIAKRLRGKHKPDYTPHVDGGDHVIVINADKAVFTGDKFESKEYFSHTGYPGGQKRKSPSLIAKKKPEFIVENAVRGMLPKNRLGRKIFTNLHVYIGAEHPHEAQNPVTVKL